MKLKHLRRSVPAFAFVAALASAQPSHAPVCQSDCWVQDDAITPGKNSCEPGITASWCERWVPGNGKCGDQWFHNLTATCLISDDVISGPCNSETIQRDGKTYKRITSADDGINICCFYAVGSEEDGDPNLVSVPTSTNACNDGGGPAVE